jgi:hypothetical protein
MKTKFAILFSILILTSSISPVFAEVIQFQLDKDTYQKGDLIAVSGTVTEDSSGLVTIVLRDPNNEFVILNQAMIRADNTFEKSIMINEKFDTLGIHNATAFVTNVTASKIQSFELVTKIAENKDVKTKEPTSFEPPKISPSEISTTPQEIPIESHTPQLEDNIDEKSEIEIITKQENAIADFVDTSKDPQYYLDRYYNEPKYKSWFDRNYPDTTIETAVGYTPSAIEKNTPKEIGNKILPSAEASSIQIPQGKEKDNSELTQLGLVLGGMAILFGAVYGIKRKSDGNTKRVLINKNIIGKKLLTTIIQPNPKEILQKRLAIGEITINEYEHLCKKLVDETN